MLDRGKVIDIKGSLALVEFVSTSACASCGICKPANTGKMTTIAENPIGSGVGDLVEVEISEAVTTLFPLIGFGLPIGSFFLGLILGSFISENIGIITGVIFLGIGFLATRVADRYISRQKKYRSRIVRALS
ncbi:MAG: SoxR reducing system RseC family protein [Candidatus Margulisiibacteriota bacterium]